MVGVMGGASSLLFIKLIYSCWESRKKAFLTLNPYLLYGHIGPALGPQPLIKGHAFYNFRRRLQGPHYHVFGRGTNKSLEK